MPTDITPKFRQMSWNERLDTLPTTELADVKGGWAFGGTEQQRGGHTLGRNVRVVPAGGSIQNAIDELNSLNGGVVQILDGTHTVPTNITIYSNISLIGQGRGTTILEFSGAARGIQAIGTAGAVKTNMLLADFTLQNSNNTAGIDIDYFDFWRMDNVRVTSCDQKGVRFQHCRNFSLLNVRSDNNTGNGFEHITDATRFCDGFSMVICESSSNGGIGYSFSSVSGQSKTSTINGCKSSDNTGDGFDVSAGGNFDSVFVGCNSENDVKGFDIDGDSVRLIGCVSELSSNDAYEVAGQGCKLIGCRANPDSAQVSFDFTGLDSPDEKLIFMGCNQNTSTSVAPHTSVSMNDEYVVSDYNVLSPRIDKKIYWMKNTSGGSLAIGDVVIFSSVVAGDAVTTTTTQGHDLVFGMAIDAISNNNYGAVLALGYTTVLKVDGTTDIAIGDLLGTFTTAKIAMKAAAGDMAFAIALEAYTTNDSNGVIDALLISPRLI